jgi:hypothetical protein
MVSEVELPDPHIGVVPNLKQPMAEGLLTALQPFLSEALVSQVGACYQFNVILPSGTQSIYFLDLTTGAAARPSPPSMLVTSTAHHAAAGGLGWTMAVGSDVISTVADGLSLGCPAMSRTT